MTFNSSWASVLSQGISEVYCKANRSAVRGVCDYFSTGFVTYPPRVCMCVLRNVGNSFHDEQAVFEKSRL